MTRKTGFILVAVVAALLGAMAAVPAFIDWTPRYKAELGSRLERALGRAVTIDGPVSLSLLPLPTFSAEGVRLANVEGASSPDMIRVRSMALRLRLLPLLGGRIELSSLVLDGPEIHLERLADGRANWQRPDAAPAPVGANPPPPAPAPAPAGGGEPREPDLIDSVTVEKGVLIYQRPGASPLRVDGVDARMTADGRLVHASGQGRVDGLALGFDATVAPADNPLTVDLALRLADGAGELRIGGQVNPAGHDFKGKLTAKGGDLAVLASRLGAGSAAALLPAGAFSLDAQLAGSAEEIDASAITLASAVGDGHGNARVVLDGSPQLDLKLAFNRFDLDAVPAPPAASAAAPAAAATPAAEPAQPGGERPEKPSFAIPKTVSAVLDLGAEVVVYRGGILRGARLNLSLANGGATINQASLSLPGDSQVNLFGYLAAEDGFPAFDGSFEGATDDLRALLAWLKVDASAVSPDRLRAARLAGKLRARQGEIDLDGTQLRLDGSRIDIAAALRPGNRPAVGVTFAVDTLNADAYWPAAAGQAANAAPPPASPAPATAAPASTGPSPAALPIALPDWLGRMDANVKGRIDQLVARGVTAQSVVIDGSWVDGELALHELSVADMAGAQLHLDGTVDGLPTGGAVLKGVHYDLRSTQPGRLVRQAAIPLPVDPDRLGAVALTGTVDGGLDALTVDTHSEAGPATVGLAGRIITPLAAPQFDLTVQASHPNLLQLIHLIAPNYRPQGSLGAFSLSTRLKGDPAQLQLSDLDLKAGTMTAAGEAKLTLSGKPRVEAALTAGDLAVDPFLSAKRDADPPPPAAAKEPPVIHGLPVDATDVVVAAPRAAVQSGAIPERWSHAPVDLSWLNAFDAGLKLDAKGLTWGRLHLDGVGIGLTLANGVAGLDRLTGQLYGGALTGSGRLSADGGVALQLGLAGGQMRQALVGVADVDIADGTMDAEENVTTSGHSLAEMVGRLGGTAKFAVHDGTVRGFDLKAADDRLQSVNGPASLLGLLQAGLTGGKTAFSNLSGSFHASNGIIVSNDIALTADGGSAKGSAEINLPASMMDARAEFHLASAPSGPPLVMRLTGPLDHPRRFMDINEIQSWLAGRVKAVKGKLLDNLLTGQGTSDGSKPKDMLKGLLRDLGH